MLDWLIENTGDGQNLRPSPSSALRLKGTRFCGGEIVECGVVWAVEIVPRWLAFELQEGVVANC